MAARALPESLTLRSRTWRWGARTFIMGVLNATPDSFSGDGLLRDGPNAIDAALAQARAMVAAGADILDVGGESTRPGGAPVGEAEEMDRVIGVIDALRRALDVPISVDTSKAAVAAAAVAAGADVINDVWALAADPRMPAVAAGLGVPVILMHNRSARATVDIPEISPPPPIGTTMQSISGASSSISSATVPCPAATCG